MKRPQTATIAAFACATLVGLLYASPVLRDVLRTGLDWPIWLDHPEGLIHTNTGKWLVSPPHRAFVEGASGEFPQYYASLSDTLLNLLAAALRAPAMSVQAVIFGPLLGAAFLLFNYLALAGVVRDRRVALGASVLLSLGGNASFADRMDPASGLPLDAILHVPFHVISLGTSQSLGWVLLLPALCLGYRAHRESSRMRALAAGLLLAALFYAHTLSFVNVCAAQLAWLVLANALERRRDLRYALWLATLGLLLGAFAVRAASRGHTSFGELTALGALALAATFLIDPAKRFYLWCYGSAGLLALPYVLLLARHRAALATMQSGWDQVQMMTVGLVGFLLFFSGYLVAAGFALRYSRERGLVAWLLVVAVATGFLAVNHLWGWSNHPYRYAIDLLFPLAILAVLGLREAPRPLALVVGSWLVAICFWNASSFALGRAVSIRFRVGEPERARFLGTVRELTARREESGQRLLPPVELTYPRGLVQAAMLMNYARIPSFIPDYRHVLWPERYHNRMGLYCFLFPGYPNEDYPFGWRACDEPLEPDPALLTLREPRLRTQVLPLYRIGLAAAPAKPFSNRLKEASAAYDWPLLAQTDNAAFVRTSPATLPGVARLAPGQASPDLEAIGIEIERAGLQLVILGGRRLDTRAPEVLLDGRPLETGRRRANWAVYEVELSEGRHLLQLPSLALGPDPQADYLYFAAVIQADVASRYVDLADAGARRRAPETPR